MKMIRARRSVSLVGIIVVFCASSVAATSQKSSGKERLDRSKIEPLLAHLTQALSRWRFDDISQLVGRKGVVFTEYGTDPDQPGFNNGRDAARKLKAAFHGAKVSCQGYSFHANALPDKAIVYYSISPSNLGALGIVIELKYSCKIWKATVSSTYEIGGLCQQERCHLLNSLENEKRKR